MEEPKEPVVVATVATSQSWKSVGRKHVKMLERKSIPRYFWKIV
jgi:hypothetical protein